MRIDRCNPAASIAGIHSGMSLTDALTLLPDLQIQPRNREAEQQQLEMLANWAWKYSSQISFDPLMLLLEVQGSLKLFGGLRALLEGIQAEIGALGHELFYALAPVADSAALLARVRPGVQVLKPVHLHQALQNIPLRRVTRKKTLLELIDGIGLSTLGDCLNLPRPELARRVGPELMQLLDRLLGRTPAPRSLWRPRDRFEQRLLLPAEIIHRHALVFPARRLLQSLEGFLRSHGAVTQHLHWSFYHREREPTVFTQGLLQPAYQSERILELFSQAIESLQLHQAVVEIALKVEQWQLHEAQKTDLFGATEALQEIAFLDRLQARMGRNAVCGLAPVADHRPERAWRYRSLQQPLSSSASGSSPGDCPVWLLPQPQPLSLRQGQPVYRGVLRLQRFSQRIESGWWDGEDVSRDYYLAQNPLGQLLWIYQDRRKNQWFLQGFYN